MVTVHMCHMSKRNTQKHKMMKNLVHVFLNYFPESVQFVLVFHNLERNTGIEAMKTERE